MPQNIYDNAQFFERYSHLPRSRQGLDGAPEWATLQTLLPPLGGLRVLDLGCGYGWFCRWAIAAGAQSVVGIDLSEKMLAQARASPHDEKITYVRGDLEAIEIESARYDLVFSSLTLHYIKDLSALVKKLRRGISPGGHFVFSVEHPVLLAPTDPNWKTRDSEAITATIWPLDRYLEEGPRVVNWLVEGVVKEHRTLATYLNLLTSDGYSIGRIEEWSPSHEQIQQNPDWAAERNRPFFLLVAAQTIP